MYEMITEKKSADISASKSTSGDTSASVGLGPASVGADVGNTKTDTAEQTKDESSTKIKVYGKV